MPDEAARLTGIDEIVNWTDPGPGGFYDDLGNPLRMQPHLVNTSYSDDPAFLRNPLTGFARSPWNLAGWRLSWIDDAESLFDAPLEMEYPDLDPAADYKVRIIYGGEASAGKRIRLQAKGTVEIHPFIPIENLTEIREFDIPHTATAGRKTEIDMDETGGTAGLGPWVSGG